MGLLGTLKADATVMAVSAEHFFGGLESEVADAVAPYVSKIRAAFCDELGYLAKTAWADVKAMVGKSIQTLAPNYADDPIGLIGAVFQAVVKQLPGELGVLEQLALHGVVSAMVAAL